MDDSDAPAKSLRLAGTLFFVVGGASLILMSFVGAAPSFWYFVSFCSLPLIGIVWLWKPRLASALAVGPLIPVVFLLQYFPGMMKFSWIWACAFAGGLVTAILLVSIAMRRYRRWLFPTVLSCCFVISAFAIDRRFTNRVSTKTYQVYFALEGHAPWGDVGPEGPDRSPPVVLYRQFAKGYCYDAFQSEELHRRLIAENPHTVMIVYNIFSDFGEERSYNVKSVDGVLLAEGQKVIRDWERSGGHILGDGEISTSTDPCH
jgi:hypothetical protein